MNISHNDARALLAVILAWTHDDLKATPTTKRQLEALAAELNEALTPGAEEHANPVMIVVEPPTPPVG